MKSNKGITIISLIIYIIILSIIIGTVSIFIKYFYSNTEETVVSKKTANQYSRFVAYLTDDINSRKNSFYWNRRTKTRNYFYY